jgi:uncharacterized membrane protein YfcA
MATAENLFIIAAAFLLAGLVKGVTGLGMPTVSLAILTATLGLKPAMALLLVPSFVTNVWQALAGGNLIAIIRRLWPLLIALCLATWLGVGVLAGSRSDLLAALLGLVVLSYAVTGLAKVELPRPGRMEGWLSPLVGAVSGMLNGMTVPVVPGVSICNRLACRARLSSRRWACCSPPPRWRWQPRRRPLMLSIDWHCCRQAR